MPDLTCKVVACDRVVTKVPGRGMCWMHYQRLRKYGTTDLPVKNGSLECEMDGCHRLRHKQGLCSTHVSRVRRKGSAEGALRIWLPAEERFWPLVTKTETCWLFDKVQANGYGVFSAESSTGRTTVAHRYAYELLVGPIPEGLQVDHLCRVRNCVRPDHLEAVTPWENTMRSAAISAVNAQKTECLRGHPFSDSNTYYSKDGRRYCIACRDARSRGLLAKR